MLLKKDSYGCCHLLKLNRDVPSIHKIYIQANLMDHRLFEASITGNVEALEALLKKDPHILIKASMFSSSAENNPLHVASLAGHVDFVRQILLWMPSFSQELNKDGFAPIHLATAGGHSAVVKELIEKGGIWVCFLKDSQGRTALHLAAVTGRIQIIEEILSRCPQAIDLVTAIGETAILLAVKNCKFEAFKVLFDKTRNPEEHEEQMNAKGGILELARATNQLQVIEFIEQKIQFNYQAITMEEHTSDNNAPEPAKQNLGRKMSNAISSYMKAWSDFYDEKVIPIVASLIAQTTYQAAVDPPQSIWKEGINLDTECLKSWRGWTFLEVTMDQVAYNRSCPAFGYYRYVALVVLAFMSSLLLIPFHGNKWVTMSLMIICLYSMLMSVLVSVATTSANNAFNCIVFAVVLFGIGSLLFGPALSLVGKVSHFKLPKWVCKGFKFANGHARVDGEAS